MFFQKCKKDYYKTSQELLNYQTPKDIEIFTISPKAKTKMTSLDNNIKLLNQMIDQGYKETISNHKLKLFLE
jgi:predicted patatin/cPLA2 family phospholipase